MLILELNLPITVTKQKRKTFVFGSDSNLKLPPADWQFFCWFVIPSQLQKVSSYSVPPTRCGTNVIVNAKDPRNFVQVKKQSCDHLDRETERVRQKGHVIIFECIIASISAFITYENDSSPFYFHSFFSIILFQMYFGGFIEHNIRWWYRIRTR